MENNNNSKDLQSLEVESKYIPEQRLSKSSLFPKINCCFSVAAVIIAAISLWISYSANENSKSLGQVTAETHWHKFQEEFFATDTQLKEWEKKEGLIRDGIKPDSTEQLQEGLQRLNFPPQIEEIYRRRWRIWNTLRQMANAYAPFNKRVISLDLTLPDHPALPKGLLLPMGAVQMDELLCMFAGVRAPCNVLIKSGFLHFPKEIIGPNGMIQPPGGELQIFIPFAIHKTPQGLVFDVTLKNEKEETIVDIKKNRWVLSKPSLPYKYDERRLEVLDDYGIPIFQIYLNEDDKTVYIGGKFVSTSGETVVAFADYLVTKNFILRGIEYRPGKRKKIDLKNSEFVGHVKFDCSNTDISGGRFRGTINTDSNGIKMSRMRISGRETKIDVEKEVRVQKRWFHYDQFNTKESQ